MRLGASHRTKVDERGVYVKISFPDRTVVTGREMVIGRSSPLSVAVGPKDLFYAFAWLPWAP